MSSTSVLRTSARRRALSLVELLIVLVILVVLSGLLVPVFSGVKERAEIAATTATMRQIQQAILGDGQNPGYFADMGRLPRPCLYTAAPSDCALDSGRGDRFDHPQIRYLFINPYEEEPQQFTGRAEDWNPSTGRGWRGPYFQQVTGRYFVDDSLGFTLEYGDVKDPRPGITGMADPAIVDAWGNPIVIQEPQNDTDAQADPRFLMLGTRIVSAGPNGRIDTPLDIWNPTPAERNDDLVLFLFGPDPFE